MIKAGATTVTPLVEWEFRPAGDGPWQLVRLPHDPMIGEARSAESVAGADLGWFQGGSYVYRRQWRAGPDEANQASLRFEGVQGEAVVSFNGVRIGSVRSGYSEFELPIGGLVRWDGDNEILVEVDNSAQPASRWYSGSGLYRSMHVVLRPATHFRSDGLRLVTRSLSEAAAAVEVTFSLEGPEAVSADVIVELVDDGAVVASASASAVEERVMLRVATPQPWSAKLPYLYDLVARIERDGRVLDERRERVGLRMISISAHEGLRVNSAPVKLRGACIHHDNGLLGAATHRAAEFRRVRLLKEAGFNAIRSAHNPMSRHLLDACDELGVYVLDEFADYWTVSKTAYDFAHRFRDTWREDANRLIEKDRNHPSVLMYAIGNEIPETAKPEGVALSREITEYFHLMDPDRPVTLAINLFLNVMVAMNRSPYRVTREGSETSMAGSTEANVMINQIGRMMNLVSRLPVADKASRDAFGVVDVAGYNYGIGRYKHDVKAYPQRVILGTETLPGDVARAWDLVQRHPAVIGDFVWAGWDFLGEAGVAVWVPGKRAGLSKPYPYILHGGGMFDLTGRPDISLRLAQVAWGQLEKPAIAVRPLDRSGIRFVRSAWRTTDAVESWSWRGCEGSKAEIEVYSADDEVELLLNGRSLGRRRAGKGRGFLARFATRYESGIVTAVGYRDGIETSRSELRSANGPLRIRLTAESDTIAADGMDLAFVLLEIIDADGTVEMLADESAEVAVNGPAELIGFGTAAPNPVHAFTTNRVPIYRGRAMAVLRSTGQQGQITLTARSESLGTAEVSLSAQEFSSAASLTSSTSASPDHAPLSSTR